MVKVSIIGAGNLGAQIAYDIANRNFVDELVLIDILADLAKGQAQDIAQSLPFRSKTNVTCGDYSSLQESDVIVITAGKPRTPQMKDRLELAQINLAIMKSIISQIKEFVPSAILIVLTNPMDLITHYIYKAGFSKNKVIGSGGQLDSSRLRVVLGHPTTKVEAFVLGEHGENQVPIFSNILIDGKKREYTNDEQEEIKEKIRKSALSVIEKKGATVFAPASNTTDLVEAIVKNQKKMMVCSVNLEGEYGISNVSLGVPVILGKDGIEKVEVWKLLEQELAQLHQAAQKLKSFYEQASALL